MRLVGVVAHFRLCANALLRPGRMFPSSLLTMLLWSLWTPSALVTDARDCFHGSSQNSAHPLIIFHQLFCRVTGYVRANSRNVRRSEKGKAAVSRKVPVTMSWLRLTAQESAVKLPNL